MHIVFSLLMVMDLTEEATKPFLLSDGSGVEESKQQVNLNKDMVERKKKCTLQFMSRKGKKEDWGTMDEK